MAKGFKHGTGGASPLNLKIIGNPKPQTAKENTIWIDTAEEITGWIFSSTQPDDMAEGQLWIATDKRSSASFNVLKKNGIQIYPVSAKQYISGQLVAKAAQIWKGGKWVDWMAYLYNAGDTCDALSGGWGNFGSLNQFSANAADPNGKRAMALNTGTNSSQNWGYASTLRKIDLSNFLLLQARVSGGRWAAGYPRIGYGSTQSAYAAFAEATSELEQDIALDISNEQGEWYVLFGSNMCQNNVYNYCYEVLLM